MLTTTKAEDYEELWMSQANNTKCKVEVNQFFVYQENEQEEGSYTERHNYAQETQRYTNSSNSITIPSLSRTELG